MCHKGDATDGLTGDVKPVLWYLYNSYVLFKLIALEVGGDDDAGSDSVIRYKCDYEYAFTWTFDMSNDFIDVAAEALKDTQLNLKPLPGFQEHNHFVLRNVSADNGTLIVNSVDYVTYPDYILNLKKEAAKPQSGPPRTNSN